MIELYYSHPCNNLTRECVEGSTKMYLEDPEKRATYEELFYQLQT